LPWSDPASWSDPEPASREQTQGSRRERVQSAEFSDRITREAVGCTPLLGRAYKSAALL
jgi:hypothetical protein